MCEDRKKILQILKEMCNQGYLAGSLAVFLWAVHLGIVPGFTPGDTDFVLVDYEVFEYKSSSILDKIDEDVRGLLDIIKGSISKKKRFSSIKKNHVELKKFFSRYCKNLNGIWVLKPEYLFNFYNSELEETKKEVDDWIKGGKDGMIPERLHKMEADKKKLKILEEILTKLPKENLLAHEDGKKPSCSRRFSFDEKRTNSLKRPSPSQPKGSPSKRKRLENITPTSSSGDNSIQKKLMF